jgi:hypothetical protein
MRGFVGGTSAVYRTTGTPFPTPVEQRETIMTITPAQTEGLDKARAADLHLHDASTYDHGGNGTTVRWYEETLGSFDRIV